MSQLAIPHDARDSGQPRPELFAFLQRAVPVRESPLQLLVRLLAFELADARLQAFYGILGALADGPLGFSVVGALLGQLLGRQVGDASRAGLAGLALAAIGSGGVVRGRDVVLRGLRWLLRLLQRRGRRWRAGGEGGGGGLSVVVVLGMVVARRRKGVGRVRVLGGVGRMRVVIHGGQLALAQGKDAVPGMGAQDSGNMLAAA